LGSLFGDLSVTLVVSILSGWLYAQFALPSLFGMFITGQKDSPQKTVGAGLEHYATFLKTCMRKPAHVLGITGMVCVIGFVFLLSRPVRFVSADTSSEIEVVLNFPSGTTMDSIASKAALLGEQLSAVPGIRLVFGRAGSEKDDTARRSDPDYRKETFVFRCIVERTKHLNQSLTSINSLLEKQAYETFARFPQDKTEKLLGLSSSFVVAVKGRNHEEAERGAVEAEERIQQKGYTVHRRSAATRQELRIIPDREALAYAGLSTAETAAAFYAATEGLVASELELQGKPLDMRVSALEMPAPEMLPITQRQNNSESAQAVPVFAGSVADFVARETPAAMARLDRSDVVYIEAASSADEKKDLAAFLDSLCADKETFTRLDESTFVRYKNSLLLTVVIVLILLYLTMGAEFESLSLPLVLLLAIPFSLSGAGPALFFSGAGLDSSSVLALMVLFGLSVNSGMVLYELAAEKSGAGGTAQDAVYEAALERFRPVLTTTLTTVFALVPLAVSPLGTKEQSMAVAMLGGIAACTALTLFALPPVLVRFMRRQKRIPE
jgi:multidrug efflux pump subunit AcrB